MEVAEFELLELLQYNRSPGFGFPIWQRRRECRMKKKFRILLAAGLVLLLLLAGAALADAPFVVRTDRGAAVPAADVPNDSLQGNYTDDGPYSGTSSTTDVGPYSGNSSAVGPYTGTSNITNGDPGLTDSTEVGPSGSTGNNTVVDPSVITGNTTVVGPSVITGNTTGAVQEYRHTGIFGNITTQGEIYGSATVDLLSGTWTTGSFDLPQQLCHASPLESPGYAVHHVDSGAGSYDLDLNVDGQDDIHVGFDPSVGEIVFKRLDGADSLTKNYTFTYGHPALNVFYSPVTINIYIPKPTPTSTPAEPPTPVKPDAATTPAPATPTPAPAVVSRVTFKGAVYLLNHKNRTAQLKTLSNKKLTVLTIPASLKANGVAYRVTAVAPGACKKAPRLARVVLGKYVAKVGKNAFYGAKKLTTVTGGAAVKELGAGAFGSCVRLKKVPVFAKLQKIGASAYKGCKALPVITLSARVRTIGKNAFYGCAALKKVNVKTAALKNGSVGAGAFRGVYKKAVFVCPKKKTAVYQTLFLQKGAPKTIIVK